LFQEFSSYCELVRKELYGRKYLPDTLQYIRDYIDALFHILDMDGDGYISKSDYIISYSEFEEVQLREEYWKRICPVNSEEAKIDRNLFNELCIEFLVSTDSSDRGNWIFGIFD
jgi:Ca2+-binding EF-hand superfamily protein